MSNFVKGQRVRVVHNIDGTEHRVGQYGTVLSYVPADAYPVRMQMDDGSDLPWKERELEVVGEPPNVTVVEGDVRWGDEVTVRGWRIGEMSVHDVMLEHKGKHVRVIIEEVAP